MSDSILLTVREVCELLRISRTSIHRMVKAGTFPPPVHVGRSPRWRRDVVEDWSRPAPKAAA